MVVLKAGEHSCRMTHAKIWKGKHEHFGMWVSGCVEVCGCVGVYVGSLYLRCVSGGVATVTSLGI